MIFNTLFIEGFEDTRRYRGVKLHISDALVIEGVLEQGTEVLESGALKSSRELFLFKLLLYIVIVYIAHLLRRLLVIVMPTTPRSRIVQIIALSLLPLERCRVFQLVLLCFCWC